MEVENMFFWICWALHRAQGRGPSWAQGTGRELPGPKGRALQGPRESPTRAQGPMRMRMVYMVREPSGSRRPRGGGTGASPMGGTGPGKASIV